MWALSRLAPAASCLVAPCGSRASRNSSRFGRPRLQRGFAGFDSILVYHVILPGGHTLSVRKGDFTKEKADVIVCPSGVFLKHEGGASKAVSLAAGPSVQVACDDWISLHGQLQDGQIVVTGAGQMMAKYVVHVGATKWLGGASGEPAKLRAEVINALRQAQFLSARSVVIPSFWHTTMLDEATDICANTTTSAVVDFLSSLNARNLEEGRVMEKDWQMDVAFTNYDTRTVAAFHSALQVLVGE